MDLSELEKKLGHSFKNRDLLVQALSHRSYVNENDTADKSYETLEFLGDAVLDFVISCILVKIHPDWSEGDLSKLRGNLVDSRSLAMKARGLDLGEYLLLGVGEEKTGGRKRDSLLADVMESVIAAVYTDAGIRKTERLVKALFMDEINSRDLEIVDSCNYKSRLQEIIQERGKRVPPYRLVTEIGPDHKKEFVVGLTLNGKTFHGWGRNKQTAEQDAARNALLEMDERGRGEND